MSASTPEQLTTAAAAGAASVWVDQAAAAVGTVADRAAAVGGRLLQAYAGWYSPAEIREMSEQLAEISRAAQTMVAGLMADYVAQAVSLLDGAPVRPPRISTPTIRNGVALETVYQRPIRAYRIEHAETGSAAAAIDAALARQRRLIEDDIMLAVREAEREAMVDLDVTHYRRVLRPERSKSGSCLLCVAASLNVYTVAELLPLHNGCKCLVLPIIDGKDPAEQLNEEDRQAAYAEAGTTDRDVLRTLRVKVQEHGELGPVLTAEGHHFTGPDQLGKSKPETAARRGGVGGSGGGGSTGTAGPLAPDEPDPLEVLALGDRVEAKVTTPHPLGVEPPTYAKVAPYVATGDPHKHFLPKELATVNRLQAARPAIDLISVADLDKVLPNSDKQRHGPDALLAGTQQTVELKALDARDGETHHAAIKRNLRTARTQARVAIIDGVVNGLGREDAIRGLRGAVGTYGHDLDLIVILLGDGTAVHWRRA